jgi:nonribosomal peptide synthetase MxcG
MTELLPLSEAQAGIWAGAQLDRNSPTYNTAEYVAFTGHLDVDALTAAIRQTIDEATALHVRFTDGPHQTVADRSDWRLHEITVDSHAEALAWMRADLDQPVDLQTGPLFTTALIRTGARNYLWYQRIHHIAADGYAFSLLARRVAAHYTARRTGTAPTAGFGSWRSVLEADAAYRDSPNFATDREFWRDYLAGMPTPATLAPSSAMARTVLRHRSDLTGLNRADPSWPNRVLAAVAAHLYRSTGATEVVLGLPVMGRLGTPALRVPCMAMNIVPLRVLVIAGDTLADLAARIGEAIRESRPHHRYRYERLRRDLGLLGGERRLFGPVVNLMPFDYRLDFAGIAATSHSLAAGPVEDLSVTVANRGRGFRLELDANPASYDAPTLARHAEALRDLITAAPDTPIGEAPVVLDGGPLPVAPRAVTELITAHATTNPGRTAIVHTGHKVSYGELHAMATELAATFTSLGAGAGTVVAIELPRGIDAVTAMLAAHYVGGGYLPLDPDGPAERRTRILRDARPGLIVTDDGIEARADGVTRPGLAYLMYTSGSTGRPNGVAVGRPALAHFVAGATDTYGITAEDRVLQFAPLHFDASVEEIFLTLCAGATLVVRTEQMLDSIPALLQACAEHGVTVLDLPTAYWHELAYARLPLPACVRTVIIGGEAALAARVAQWHSTVDPKVRLFNTYGPTEATVVATVAHLRPGDEDVPIGRPLPGVRALLADGELYLLGGGLADGYLSGPPRFTTVAGARAYRTGDRVRLRADGQLVFVGRVDDEFKISGHRVDPAEIEAVLLRHPDVREVAVVGHAALGGSRRLVAHVAGAAAVAELRSLATRHLPAAVAPSSFVYSESLPKTRNGKIDRAALRAEVTSAPIDDTALSPMQREVLAVWCEVLDRTDLSIQDDFFELGGQSLQTIQVATRLGTAASTVFANPTVAALASALKSAVDDVRSADYPADAVLPADIWPRAGDVRHGRVLLTGATGFVGCHLLGQLLAGTDARVACLVRADSQDAALDRLRRTATERGVAVDWDRVDVVAGQLTDTPSDVDSVYHAAATVSLTRGYQSMRSSNVAGTMAMLRIGVPVHHVSTVAVGAAEESFVAAGDHLRDGYQQSKWVAEELLRKAGERGLPVAVYRLGRVVGPRATGYVNPDDLVWRLLLAGIPAGVLPDLDVAEPWTPADDVARAIVALSRQEANGVYHLTPNPPVHFRDVATWVREYGYPVTVVALPEWLNRLRSSPSPQVAATVAVFDGGQPPMAAQPPAFGRANGFIRSEPMDRTYLHTCLDYAVTHGLLHGRTSS